MSIDRKATAVIYAVIILCLVSCSPVLAQISCQDLKYGSPQYHDKMDELAKQAGLPDNSWNRYHESIVRYFCDGDIKGVHKLVDTGMVKAQEAKAIGKVLGKTYKAKPRSEVGKRYGSSRRKFAEMGACSACADNIAQYYSKKPDSHCGELAQQALDGNQEAIKELATFPDYCKWLGPSNVRDCRPCSFSPGDGFPTYSFTFDLKTVGDERTVEAIEVASQGSAIQRLPVTRMDPVGKDEDFFFGGQDINFDGLLDLMLITRRGGANADASYWLFDPKTKTFKALGTYPIFTVDTEKRRLSTYVRGGSAGLIHESREYAFVDQKLTLMREEKQQTTQQPGIFRKVIRERVGGVMKVVKTERVQSKSTAPRPARSG